MVKMVVKRKQEEPKDLQVPLIKAVRYPSITELEIMKIIQRNRGISGRAIADQMGLQHTGVTTSLSRLKQKGLIYSKSWEKRNKHLETILDLTEEGIISMELMKSGKFEKFTVITPVE